MIAELSQDQLTAQDAIIEFVRQRGTIITMGGYAGVGKTTVIAQTIKTLRLLRDKNFTIGFCCYTGKAASVLGAKLRAAGALEKNDYCGTIHGMIYSLDEDTASGKTWRKRSSIPYDVIVLDEASMVNEEILLDLKSYGIPIVAVGDHGQLPPVNGRVNLMANPQLRLEKIHRQAADNPIIKLSMMARLDGYIPVGTYSQYVNKVRQSAFSLGMLRGLDEIMFLCGRNRTRVSLNYQIRKALGFKVAEPCAGEKVICLKNEKKMGVFNGMIGRVKSCAVVSDHHYDASIAMEGTEQTYDGRILRHQFNQEKTLQEYGDLGPFAMGGLFDFGYALTVHKSQGSEAARVVFFEERFPKMSDEDWRRLQYTAITRSSERLLIVGN